MATLQDDKIKGLLSGWGLAARPCDTCRSAAALLFCRTDAAFLCGSCDSKIHRHVAGTRHERVWMCEVCEQSPAAVTCKSDAAVLCTACDRDIHSANPLARRHERVPVVPFFDSAAEAAVRSSAASATPAFLISDDLAVVPAATSAVSGADADTWLIPSPNFLYNNDSNLFDFGGHGSQNEEKVQVQQQKGSFENNPSFAFTDSVVPTQSNGNLIFSNDANHTFQNCFDIDFSQPNKLQKQLISAFSASSSDIGVVPDGNAYSMSEVSYTFTKSASNPGSGDGTTSVNAGSPAPGMDREARVMRYRERRKNRKFEKTIRYASRKAYAETRPRIKGRFAKRTETSDTSEIDQIFGLGSGLTGFSINHGGYGVVPSF